MHRSMSSESPSISDSHLSRSAALSAKLHLNSWENLWPADQPMRVQRTALPENQQDLGQRSGRVQKRRRLLIPHSNSRGHEAPHLWERGSAEVGGLPKCPWGLPPSANAIRKLVLVSLAQSRCLRRLPRTRNSKVCLSICMIAVKKIVCVRSLGWAKTDYRTLSLGKFCVWTRDTQTLCVGITLPGLVA